MIPDIMDKMKNTIIACCLLLLSDSSFGQTLQDTLTRIENAMRIYMPQNPGCQLSIQRNGQIIYSKAFGLADLERNVPMTLTSKTEAGSVSKQFTAAAILLLEQQGKLSQKDDIRKYLPELKAYGKVITIEQLIHHTSGLKDWGAVAALAGWERTTKAYTNEDVLEIIAAQNSLNNIPGAEFIYSNSNYNLMAIIVQRASGMSLAEFAKKYLFIPAGMTNTEWRDNRNRIVNNRAIAYQLTKSGYEILMPNEDAYGNGGLLTTTEDLLKWNNYYLSGKFGSPSLLSKQTEVLPFNNGKMNDYGAGLFIQQFRGQLYIQHSGATAGYRANLEYFPTQNLSIAFLSNTSQFDTTKIRLANILKDIFIAETSSSISNTAAPTERVQITTLNNYTGWYKNERDGVGAQITVQNGELYLNNALLISKSDYRFITPSSRWIEFIQPNEFANILPGLDTIRYTKVAAPEVNSAYLQQFIGKYFSAETNAAITVFMKEGKLAIKLKPNAEYTLQPTYKDGFNIVGFGGNLYFQNEGKVKSYVMKISVSRARNITYQSVK